jgi:hypothetical protein
MLFTNFSEKNKAAHASSKVESLRKSNAISKNLQISTATDNKIRAAWRSQSKGVKAKNNFLPEIPPKEPILHKSSQITAIKNSMPAKKNFELERNNLALRREAMSSSKYCHRPDSKSGVKHRESRSSLSEFPYEPSKSRLKKHENEGNLLLFEDSKFISKHQPSDNPYLQNQRSLQRRNSFLGKRTYDKGAQYSYQLQSISNSNLYDYFVYIHRSFFKTMTKDFLGNIKSKHNLLEWRYDRKLGEGRIWRISGHYYPKLRALTDIFAAIKQVMEFQIFSKHEGISTMEDWKLMKIQSQSKTKALKTLFNDKELSFIILVPSWFEELLPKAIKSTRINKFHTAKPRNIRMIYSIKDVCYRAIALREIVPKSVETVKKIYKYFKQNPSKISVESTIPQPNNIENDYSQVKLILK